MFLLQPLQKLCFCDKQPMKNSRQVWILIVEFMAREPFRGKSMPTGVPLFLWYDDMVCPDRGPDDLTMRFPQIPQVPKISFGGVRPPLPPGKRRASLQLTRSRSAPAHLCGIWRHLPPHGHTKRSEVLIETLLRPNPPPEPLLIKPSARTAADHFRFALSWPCKPDAIWALRTQEQSFYCQHYQPWRCRKMKWRVEQEAAERRTQPARPFRAGPSWASHSNVWQT
jgi:hypothetical protein